MKEWLAKLGGIDRKVLGFLALGITIAALGLYVLWKLVSPHLFR